MCGLAVVAGAKSEKLATRAKFLNVARQGMSRGMQPDLLEWSVGLVPQDFRKDKLLRTECRLAAGCGTNYLADDREVRQTVKTAGNLKKTATEPATASSRPDAPDQTKPAKLRPRGGRTSETTTAKMCENWRNFTTV